MQRIVLVGGSGYLGRALTSFFTAQEIEVVNIARHNPQNEARFVEWDGLTLGSWARELDGADAVINLAGKSVNCRYNAENRRQILESRTQTTGLVALAIAEAKKPPRVWLNASSATFYPHSISRAMDETDAGGSGFSVDVCQQWENALFSPALPRTRRVALRTAMVFGPEKGSVWDAFSSLVKAGFGGPMAGGRQFVSWLHIHDFVRAVQWIIEHDELQGPANITSPNPLPNVQFLSAIRCALHRPYALPTARWQLEIGAALRGTETELLLKSRRVVPGKLLQSSFKFEFSQWESAVKALVQ